jgi:hypothetical protein
VKALLFVPKRVTREIVFFSKTQSCFHIYSIKTISNGLHILKEVIRRGLFLKPKSQHLI